MKESTLLEIYCPMLVIPFWFIFYTLHRLRRHWNDGKENQKSSGTPSLYLKYILIWCMLMITVAQVFLTLKFNEDEFIDIKVIKLVIFGAFVVAWIMSFVMLKIEFKFRLRMKWIGHRSFWPTNLIIYGVLFVMEGSQHHWSVLGFLSSEHLIVNLIGLILCFMLTVLAVCKPNEFSKSKDDVSANLIKKARFSVGVRNSTPEDRGLAGAIEVSIKNYKIKVENNKQVVLYNITVKIKGEVSKIRRTYHEFDKLYKAIRRSFPLEVFPYMSFPSFPVFSGTKLTLEEKTSALSEFLNGLCCPEFMFKETLDFLNIKGEFRDKLLEEHEEILEAEKAVAITEQDEVGYSRESFIADNRISVFEKSNKIHSHLHCFFRLEISVNELAGNKKEFIVVWNLIGDDKKVEVVKEFKDFNTLNGNLKKALATVLLPKFPEKSYVQNLRKVDSQALEIRRRKLEKYLSHLLNDPAFICQELLDFINCTVDISALMDRPCQSEYELNGPVGWEGELEGSSSYIIYIMSFAKYYEGEKVVEWSVKRSFKDFQYMDTFLFKRIKSPEFLKYLNLFKQKVGDWPKLPTKHPTSLSNPSEIEICRSEIQNYMEELCSVTLIATAYAFKSFIGDPDPRF